ncbi:MAG: hypothetical protein IKW51_01790 [Bacteroidales bacterium]|nr:hypothetical protein [Bacteroidales bacterium]
MVVEIIFLVIPINQNLNSNHFLCKVAKNRQTSSADLSAKDWECFLSIGFSNHREIIRKTSTLEERLFYIQRCAKEFWNVETTKYHLKEDLYHKGLMTKVMNSSVTFCREL